MTTGKERFNKALVWTGIGVVGVGSSLVIGSLVGEQMGWWDSPLTPNKHPNLTPDNDNNSESIDVALPVTATASPPPTASATATSVGQVATEAVPVNTPDVVVLPQIPGADIFARYEGQHIHNNILEGNSGDSVWKEIIENLKAEYPFAHQLLATDSLLTNLINPFTDSDSFEPDATKESGLGHTAADFDVYEPINDVVRDTYDANMTVDQLGHYNSETGLFTFGFYGPAHDLGALTAYPALVLAYQLNPEEFTDAEGKVMSVKDALASEELRPLIASYRDELEAETHERYLSNQISDSEESRRARMSEYDTDWRIDSYWRRPTEDLTCDDPREDMSRNGFRSIDPQLPPREVRHVEDGRDINGEADNNTEQLLFVGTIDLVNGIYDVDRFTGRGYKDPENKNSVQDFSASGEEERPCGKNLPAPASPTPQATNTPVIVVSQSPTATDSEVDNGPTPTVYFTNTPEVKETNTPEIEITPSPIPSQPQPTNTPRVEPTNEETNEPEPTEEEEGPTPIPEQPQPTETGSDAETYEVVVIPNGATVEKVEDGVIIYRDRNYQVREKSDGSLVVETESVEEVGKNLDPGYGKYEPAID